MQTLIYSDEGVSPFSLRETLKTFSQYSNNTKRITCKKLIEEDWEKKTDLLVIPGGKDIPYDRKLKKKGTNKIRKFVENGGHYIGICAGAYFGSAKIIFEKGTPLEVNESRELKFFPGTSIGTIYPLKQFSYDSESGAYAAEISFEKGCLNTYYNGGCLFHQAENYPSVKILARYKDAKNQAAVVLCKIGSGSAILSGIHFEVDAFSLKKQNLDKETLKKLENSNKKRQLFISFLLDHL